MFGNLKEKLEAHAKEELVQELASTGEAHVKGIGTWRYDRETREITFEADDSLKNELAYRAFPVRKGD